MFPTDEIVCGLGKFERDGAGVRNVWGQVIFSRTIT